jgi:hypothetical protein
MSENQMIDIARRAAYEILTRSDDFVSGSVKRQEQQIAFSTEVIMAASVRIARLLAHVVEKP